MTKFVYIVVTKNGPVREYSGALGLGEDFTITGLNHNPRQRAELQGQPRIGALLGPMFDGYDDQGRARIRYECEDAYASYD